MISYLVILAGSKNRCDYETSKLNKCMYYPKLELKMSYTNHLYIFLGDAECAADGNCKNGKCGFDKNGRASCTCNEDHVKDFNELCTMIGKI